MKKLALTISTQPTLFRIEFLKETLKYVHLRFRPLNRADFDSPIRRMDKYLKGLDAHEGDFEIPIEIWVPEAAVWNRGDDDIAEVKALVLKWAKILRLKAYVWEGHGYILK